MQVSQCVFLVAQVEIRRSPVFVVFMSTFLQLLSPKGIVERSLSFSFSDIEEVSVLIIDFEPTLTFGIHFEFLCPTPNFWPTCSMQKHCSHV